MQFDYPTSLFVSAVINIIMAFIFLTIYRAYPSFKQMKYWGLSFFIIGIGQFVLIGENALKLPLPLLISSTLIITGGCILIAGMYAHLDKKLKVFKLFILPVIILLTSILFNFIYPNAHLRKIFFSLVMAANSVWIFIMAWLGLNQEKSYGWNIIKYVYAFSVIFFMLRAIIIALTPFVDKPFNAYVAISFQVWVVFMNILTCIALVTISVHRYIQFLQYNISLKDKMYSAIGHDLKEPLAHIYSLSNIALSERLPHSGCKEIVHNIRALSQNANYLAKNLLEWSHSVQSEIKPEYRTIHVNETIQSEVKLYRNLADQKKIQIKSNIDESIFLKTDDNMFRLIIRNLINNAVKFTGQWGKVEIAVQKNNRRLQVIIKDNGIGMSQEKIKQLKKGEHIIHSQNKGIGLSLVERYAKLLNVQIDFESKPNKGTTYYLSFPIN